jgi:SRSO17 transposase
MEQLDSTKLQSELAALGEEIKGFFKRSESFRNAMAYLEALSFPPCQRNCWTLAETAGFQDPQAFQRLLRTAQWDHQAIRQWHEQRVYAHLAHPQGRWGVDDTGFLKKGSASAGVQRQYSGTAGRTENCQIGVALAYTSPKGYALTDWRLYLPESWLKDPERCKEAGIPEATVFQTKAQLVQEMVAKALAAGYRAACLTADADYGKAPYLRAFLKQEQIAFALGLQKKVVVVWLKGKLRPLHASSRLREADVSLEQIAQDVQEWLVVPLKGSQGGNPHEWASAQIVYEGERYELVMRRLGKDIRYFLCWSPEPQDFLYWVSQIAGRWDIERCFQEAKQEVGLDEYQVRKWQAWYRHVILCTVLMGLLARVKSQFPEEKWTIAQLCQVLRIPFLARGVPPAHSWHWLRWKRKHNAKAAKAHRKRWLKTLLYPEAA